MLGNRQRLSDAREQASALTWRPAWEAARGASRSQGRVEVGELDRGVTFEDLGFFSE